jgi:hypothetical protein
MDAAEQRLAMLSHHLQALSTTWSALFATACNLSEVLDYDDGSEMKRIGGALATSNQELAGDSGNRPVWADTEDFTVQATAATECILIKDIRFKRR